MCSGCFFVSCTDNTWCNDNLSSLSTGNYYSLRSQHEKAALYFQRALKLNPRCLGAWTLMGHEYMEMKNTSAAIQAYRSDWQYRKPTSLKMESLFNITAAGRIHVITVYVQACHRGEQAGLPCLVRFRSDLWNPQNAFLLFVLLSKGSSATVWTSVKCNSFNNNSSEVKTLFWHIVMFQT